MTWGSFHDDGLRTSLYHVQVYRERLASFTDNMHIQDAACSACICLSTAWDILFVDCQQVKAAVVGLPAVHAQEYLCLTKRCDARTVCFGCIALPLLTASAFLLDPAVFTWP